MAAADPPGHRRPGDEHGREHERPGVEREAPAHPELVDQEAAEREPDHHRQRLRQPDQAVGGGEVAAVDEVRQRRQEGRLEQRAADAQQQGHRVHVRQRRRVADQQRPHRHGAQHVGPHHQPLAREAVDERPADQPHDHARPDLRDQQQREVGRRACVARRPARRRRRAGRPSRRSPRSPARPTAAGRRGCRGRSRRGRAPRQPRAARPSSTGATRERPTRCRSTNAPRHSTTSPMEKTLASGQPAGTREDVAEEPQVRVGHRRGVGELTRDGEDAGQPQGVRVGRHDPVVGGDRQQVQQPAEGQQRQPGDAQVGADEGEDQAVADEVRDGVEVGRARREDAEDDDLQDHCGDPRPASPEADARQMSEPSAQQWHRRHQQGERPQQQHAYAYRHEPRRDLSVHSSCVRILTPAPENAQGNRTRCRWRAHEAKDLPRRSGHRDAGRSARRRSAPPSSGELVEPLPHLRRRRRADRRGPARR